MKGVLLAGGSGSRLGHLTKITNKHLLPVGKYPMIHHPLMKLVEAGIKEILVVTGCEHIGSIVGYLGSGSEFNCTITYKIQDKAGGIAEALYLAKDFAGTEDLCVLLGDNIFTESLVYPMLTFIERKEVCDALIVLYGLGKSKAYKQRFGVAFMNSVGTSVETLIEKPSMLRLEELSSRVSGVVTGIYFYDSSVFEKIEQLNYSDRGELEITDVNNLYLQGGKLRAYDINGEWTDAGTFESYHKANLLLNQ